MEAIIYLVIFILIYFVPTFVGWEHKQNAAIVCLNIFLGWTFIGWVVALVWALTDSE